MSSSDRPSGNLDPSFLQQATASEACGVSEQPTFLTKPESSVVPDESPTLMGGVEPSAWAATFSGEIPNQPIIGRSEPPPSGTLTALAASPSGPSQGTGAVLLAARAPWYRVLARPLPFWLRAIGTALLVVGLVAVFFFSLAQGKDWAEGLLSTGIGAAILAGVLLVATAVRALAGMAVKTNALRARQLGSASVLLGVLLVFAGEGILLQGPVHHVHGVVLESQQQWEHALKEFQLAGQRPPDSQDLARTYNDWGEHLSAAGQYEAAIAKFEVVVHTFSPVTAQVQRAQADEIAAYFGWGNQAARQQNFASATAHYDTLLQLPFCDAGCRQKASALDATAYYQLAEVSLSLYDYSPAVSAFQTLQSRFNNSPEAQKIHADFARALLGLGQQERQQSPCPDAIATYQNLIQNFADTPEGKQAAIDYKAPEPVIGRFTSTIGYFVGGKDIVFLLKGAYIGMPSSQLINLANQALRAGRAAPISLDISSDSFGSFTFKSMPQGTYVLTWAIVDSSGSGFLHFPPNNGSQYTYAAHVGPLCAYDFGSIPEVVDVPLN